MEELKQKFAKQVAFIDKMRENIIINSNNFDILKNLTHSLQEKVLVLEKAAEHNEYMEHQKKIKKKLEEIKYEKVELKNFWRERFLALEKKVRQIKINSRKTLSRRIVQQKKYCNKNR